MKNYRESRREHQLEKEAGALTRAGNTIASSALTSLAEGAAGRVAEKSSKGGRIRRVANKIKRTRVGNAAREYHRGLEGRHMSPISVVGRTSVAAPLFKGSREAHWLGKNESGDKVSDKITNKAVRLQRRRVSNGSAKVIKPGLVSKTLGTSAHVLLTGANAARNPLGTSVAVAAKGVSKVFNRLDPGRDHFGISERRAKVRSDKRQKDLKRELTIKNPHAYTG